VARQNREPYIIQGPTSDLTTPTTGFFSRKDGHPAWVKNGGQTTKNSRLLSRATSASVRTGIQTGNIQVRKQLTNNHNLILSKPELVIEGTNATESTNHNSGGS
jgi:hypothetical protein